MKFDEYSMGKWENYQSVDIAASNLQNSLLNISKYDDKEKILKYNDFLEEMRRKIHEIMKECE